MLFFFIFVIFNLTIKRNLEKKTHFYLFYGFLLLLQGFSQKSSLLSWWCFMSCCGFFYFFNCKICCSRFLECSSRAESVLYSQPMMSSSFLLKNVFRLLCCYLHLRLSQSFKFSFLFFV